MNDNELAALRVELGAIAQNLAQAKVKGLTLNEAQIEFVVIDPILKTLGYSPLEIAKQGHNATTGAIPDYTILPGTDDTWFLEGKSFNFSLSDKEAAQAVNYAHNHGARWAVLTNGRAWHIYDAHSTLSLPEKRILQIVDVFSEPDAVSTLALLSRDAMCSGGILAAQALQKLNAIVRRELETPHSNLRKSLQDTVQKETGGTVSDEVVGAALLALINENTPAPSPPVRIPESSSLASAPAPSVSSPSVAVSLLPSVPHGWYTLEQLSANSALVTGRKPTHVSFDKGEAVIVKSWKGVLQFGVDQVSTVFGLPSVPFALSGKSKRYLLNDTPVRADGKPMIAHIMLKVAERNVAVDTNLSAKDIVRALLKLIDAVGAPINCMQVGLEIF